MKFRYLIVDLEDGEVEGTGSRPIALDFSTLDNCVVIDCLTGEVLAPDSDDNEAIPEVSGDDPAEDEDEDDEENF